MAGLGGGHAADLPVISWPGRTMGSPYTVQVVGAELDSKQVEALQAEIEQRLK